jgi:hypothetical protein
MIPYWLRIAIFVTAAFSLASCAATSQTAQSAAAAPAAIAQAQPAAPPQVAPPPPPVVAPQPASEPAARAVPAAARAPRAPAVPAAPPSEDQTMTVTRARELCWMAQESQKVRRDIDTRLKLVEKCVEEKMNATIRR